MNKFIIMCLLGILTFTTNATTGSIKSPPVDTTSLTYNKVYSDIKESLKGLGSALKVSSEHVYKIIVQQQLVDSITRTILFIIALVLLIICIKTGVKKEWTDSSVAGITSIIGVIICVLTIIYCLGHTKDIVMGFVNPEYGAIQDIMEFIKH